MKRLWILLLVALALPSLAFATHETSFNLHLQSLHVGTNLTSAGVDIDLDLFSTATCSGSPIYTSTCTTDVNGVCDIGITMNTSYNQIMYACVYANSTLLSGSPTSFRAGYGQVDENDVDFTNLYADYFYGDGSGLTNITADDLDINDDEWLYLDTANTKGVQYNSTSDYITFNQKVEVPNILVANSVQAQNGYFTYLSLGYPISPSNPFTVINTTGTQKLKIDFSGDISFLDPTENNYINWNESSIGEWNYGSYKGLELFAGANGIIYLYNPTEVTGNLTVAGNVTADYFVGDGSQLTGLNISTLQYWNRSGISTIKPTDFDDAVIIKEWLGVGSTVDGYITGDGNQNLTVAGGDGYCFSGETLITTPTGTKQIKDLVRGETITAYDVATSQYKNATVKSLTSNIATDYYVINSNIEVTGEHYFWTDSGWKKAQDLTTSDKLFDGSSWITITSITSVSATIEIYHLLVTEPNTFFADGLLVHNKDLIARAGKDLFLTGGYPYLSSSYGDVYLAYDGISSIGQAIVGSDLILYSDMYMDDDRYLIFDTAQNNGIYYDSGIGQLYVTTDNGTYFDNNITAPYFIGDGSQLTNITATAFNETDPIWTANSTAVLNWNKTYADTLYAPTGYGDDWNETYADTLYYSITNPNGYYNSTTLPPTATNWSNVTADILPRFHNTYGIGNSTFRFTEGYFQSNVTAYWFNGNIDWSYIQNAPAFLLTETDPIWTANSSTVARTGNCPAGQFVMNTTTGGVQCLQPSHSALSNLNWDVAGHIINANVVPNTNNAYSLGNTSNYWSALYSTNATIGNSTGNTTVTPTGTTFFGTAQPTDFLEIESLYTGTSPPATVLISTIGVSRAFDDGTDEQVYTHVRMPSRFAGGNVILRYTWLSITATAGNCVWAVDYRAYNDNELQSVGTATLSETQTTKGTTYNRTTTLGFTIPNVEPTDTLELRIYRDANNGADTLIGDAYLLHATIEFPISTI